jgi:putative glycosyltransferase (TIGR04372 family)
MTLILKKILKPIVIFNVTKIFIILNFLFKIKVSTIAEDRIGYLAAACDLYLRKINLKNKKEIVLIFIDNPCNLTLLNLLKKNMNFINSSLIKRLVNISKSQLIISNIFVNIEEDLYAYSEYNKSKSTILLSEYQKIDGYNQISKWGISENDWWVCFHGRDENYLNIKYPNKNFSYHSYRNFDINTMSKGINEVISRGGYAIVMGDKESNQLARRHKKIIHYNKLYRTDFLDIFLCSNAKFFVGNSSGLKAVSQSFNVPICVANQIGFNFLIQNNNSLIIYKKLFSTKKNKILTFSEMDKMGLFDKSKGKKAYFSKFYEDNKLIPIENSKDEIKGLISDMFDLIDNNQNFDLSTSEEFKNKFFRGYSKISMAGNIAPSFLNLNKSLFNVNS